ncbi:ABC transporter permease [Alicyclobacillus sp. ALC3]|uniref:ABC transporter permease n=1 Tax=Alicyclobacillus sp. ALC3 TaxID=2796143 RepID=UPI002377FD8E|nr:ABC transporter permease [Alicyclobacillus sp. ALC3]WDL96108.1 ABC transporter permease [Alicyclobacillus sp. ALC3]
MSRLIPRRTVQALFALLAFSLVIFFVLHLDHGDPARALLGQLWTPSKGAALDRKLGLNRPVYVQYFLWIQALFQAGGLGAVIKLELPRTLELLVTGVFVAFVVSIVIAQWQIRKQGSMIDRGLSALTGMLSAVPGFVIGTLLVLLLAINVPWFPATAFAPPESGFFQRVYYNILPTAALSLSVIGPWTRQLRTSLGSVAQSDYIRTARSKGMSEARVVSRHMRRNGLLPLISLVGLSMPTMINTLIAIEIIYGVQGVGEAFIGSLNALLFANASTVALVLAFMTVFGSLVADLVSILVDPRIQDR